jgi:S1-C subfamily serine protease
MDEHRDAATAQTRETRLGRPGWRSIPTGRPWAFGAGVVVAVLAMTLVLALVLPLGAAAPVTMSERDVRSTVEEVIASQVPGPAFSALVYEAIVPSLVLVRTDRVVDVDGEGSPAQALGTAVVVTSSGDSLTALHVVEGRSDIVVTFADGTTTPASIVLEDAEQDIAVLRPVRPPEVVIPATLGNPAGVRIGSEAYIVGHPYGLVGSLSAGVVSGLERTFRRPENGRLLSGLIQVDAAVNPGNSGGPLLDRSGHVTGIVTALVNPTQDHVFIGIGLAVPIDAAAGVAGLPPY